MRFFLIAKHAQKKMYGCVFSYLSHLLLFEVLNMLFLI